MIGETLRPETSLQAMFEAGERRLRLWQVGANLIGASIVTSYFVFFDRVFPAGRIQNTFYVVAIMFPVLVAIAICFFYYWQKDLKQFIRLDTQHREINVDLRKRSQRKIIDLPFMSAAMSFFNWFIAAITMTTYSLISKL
jgi:Na+/melibiose symporter-like transporter